MFLLKDFVIEYTLAAAAATASSVFDQSVYVGLNSLSFISEIYFCMFSAVSD